MHRGSEAPEKRDREKIESDDEGQGAVRENETLPKFLEMRPSEQRTGEEGEMRADM